MKLTFTEYDLMGDERFTVVLDADGEIAVTMKDLVIKARRARKDKSGKAKSPRGDAVGKYQIFVSKKNK